MRINQFIVLKQKLYVFSMKESKVRCLLGAQACVLCFSTVDRESYDAIEQWMAKVRRKVERKKC